MIALILLLFMECPVLIKIPIEIQGPEFENGFAAF